MSCSASACTVRHAEDLYLIEIDSRPHDAAEVPSARAAYQYSLAFGDSGNRKHVVGGLVRAHS